MEDLPLNWIGAGELIAGKVPRTGAVVLLLDFADVRLQSIPPLLPTQRDAVDLGKPIAGKREFFLARRALLRRLVGLWLGVRPEGVVIGHDEEGRPTVLEPQGSGLHVSVSGREMLAALAVAPVPVGVDIEPLGEPREPVWTVLHAREKGGIESIWRQQGEDWPFLALWTAKEAYLKAVGLGLKRDPARLDVRYESDEIFFVHDPEGGPHDPAGASCRAQLMHGEVICSVIILAG